MEQSTQARMGRSEWGQLVLLSMIWGSAFLFMKIALTELTPLTIVMIRLIIAALVLNLVMRARGLRFPSNGKTWRDFIVMGFLNNMVPFSLIIWGQTLIPSSLASILNATTPIWTVLFAHFLTKDEKLTSNRLIGVLFGFLGVIIMIGLDSLQGISSNVFGQLAVVGAASCYALAGIYGKRLRSMQPLVAATGQISSAAVLMIPVTLLIDKPFSNFVMPSLPVWGAILGLGLLCTTFAYIIYFQLLAKVGATNILLVTFLIPISAILLGVLVLGEQLDLRHLIGIALIAASLVTIDGRLLRRKAVVQECDG